MFCFFFFFLQAPVKLVQRDMKETIGAQKLDVSHHLSQRSAQQVVAQVELQGSAGMFSSEQPSYGKHEL